MKVRGKKSIAACLYRRCPAPHFKMAIELFERVYRWSPPGVAAKKYCRYLSLIAANKQVTWLKASDLNVRGTSWQRVLDIVLAVGGTRYVTAHGAKDYLAHECFEDAGIEVEYINYSKSPYGQRFGEFTPSVSILDAIANLGLGASNIISPTTKPWRAFLRSAF